MQAEKAELIIAQLSLLHNADIDEPAKASLIESINYLLLHDFCRLVHILSRVDVDEKKLKGLLLQHTNTDAAIIIAELLIERNRQKQQVKKHTQTPPPDIPEDEKW